MKKRIVAIALTALIVGAVFVSATYALLLSKSRSLVNTFVSGNIELTLTESTGSRYTLVPGCNVKKDPRITVKDGSEECWLFFKADGDDMLDTMVTYEASDGWTPLTGAEGVWWRRVAESNADREYRVLKSDSIFVKETVTEEQLSTLDGNIKLSFTAYAVQCEGIPTPEKAWEIMNEEDE